MHRFLASILILSIVSTATYAKISKVSEVIERHTVLNLHSRADATRSFLKSLKDNQITERDIDNYIESEYGKAALRNLKEAMDSGKEFIELITELQSGSEYRDSTCNRDAQDYLLVGGGITAGVFAVMAIVYKVKKTSIERGMVKLQKDAQAGVLDLEEEISELKASEVANKNELISTKEKDLAELLKISNEDLSNKSDERSAVHEKMMDSMIIGSFIAGAVGSAKALCR